jgi:hypothetical protein
LLLLLLQEVKSLKSTIAKMESTARQKDALLADKTALADQLQVRDGSLAVVVSQYTFVPSGHTPKEHVIGSTPDRLVMCMLTLSSYAHLVLHACCHRPWQVALNTLHSLS